jgi:hypothetical protein
MFITIFAAQKSRKKMFEEKFFKIHVYYQLL